MDDALSVLNGYQAAMDEPFMLIYEEARGGQVSVKRV